MDIKLEFFQVYHNFSVCHSIYSVTQSLLMYHNAMQHCVDVFHAVIGFNTSPISGKRLTILRVYSATWIKI